MAINVICPGCHARFKVSDQFGGRTGPCPKCKVTITIPKAELVVHEPVHEAGAKTATGQLVLKPLERKETVLNPMLIAGFAIGAVMCLGIALLLGRNPKLDKTVVLALGAVILAPPLVWGGYNILRDDEQLEGFSGVTLWTRVALCSAGYAGLWWFFGFIYGRFYGENPADITSLIIMGPVFIALGCGIAMACFDFDPAVGFFHYALYAVVTITLRMAMGLPPVGPAEAPPATPAVPPLPGATALLEVAQEMIRYWT